MYIYIMYFLPPSLTTLLLPHPSSSAPPTLYCPTHLRGPVSPSDRDWFLRLANSQHLWKASTQLVNETVISSSYSEDLLGVMEKSLNRMKPRLPLNQKINSVTMAMFKKYLSQLLGSSTQREGQDDLVKSNPLMLYDAEVRPHPLDHTHYLYFNCKLQIIYFSQTVDAPPTKLLTIN